MRRSSLVYKNQIFRHHVQKLTLRNNITIFRIRFITFDRFGIVSSFSISPYAPSLEFPPNTNGFLCVIIECMLNQNACTDMKGILVFLWRMYNSSFYLYNEIGDSQLVPMLCHRLGIPSQKHQYYLV